MRKGIAVFAILSLIALPVSEVGAVPAKSHKGYVKRDRQMARGYANNKPRRPKSQEWYPRDSSKLPFGSAIWWDQMLRENRLTCCN
jgi:hypothetical protein